MKKRIREKLAKRAREKIRAGEPRTRKERVAFISDMELWLGPEIVQKIKQLGR